MAVCTALEAVRAWLSSANQNNVNNFLGITVDGSNNNNNANNSFAIFLGFCRCCDAQKNIRRRSSGKLSMVLDRRPPEHAEKEKAEGD